MSSEAQFQHTLEKSVSLSGTSLHTGEKVKLTPTEYETVKYLALHAGRVVTHRQLLRAVWGPNYQEETHYLSVYVGQLRRKIEADPAQPRYITTEPGVGYRFISE